MAKRQDSSSNSAHENQRPNPHNEDTVPENTDPTGRGDEELDEFDETEMDEVEEEDSDESDY